MAGALTAGPPGADGGRAPRLVAVGDPHDPRLDDYRDLPDRARRGGPGGGTVLVEGHLAIRRLLASPLTVRSLLLAPRAARLLEADLAGVDAPAYLAEPSVLAAVVGFDLHRGALAVAARPPALDAAEVLHDAEAVAVLEDVNDHENLGAVARSAVALGMDALLLSPGCADPLYRRSVRVSMGHVLTLPTARLAPWPDALRRLGDDGWTVVALSTEPDAAPLDTVAATCTGRVAVLLGAEGRGLSPAAVAAATTTARIPMARGVDSLNVAAAAAVAFARLGRASRVLG